MALDLAVLVVSGAGAFDAVRSGFGGAGTRGVEAMAGGFGGTCALSGGRVVDGAFGAAVARLATDRGAGGAFVAVDRGVVAAILGGFGVAAGDRVASVGVRGRGIGFKAGALGVVTRGEAISGRVGLATGRGVGRGATPILDLGLARSPLKGSLPWGARA